MDILTICGLACVLIGVRIIYILNRKDSMRPTDEQIAGACDRYRNHIEAVSGEQTIDAFCGSPYMRLPGRGIPWHWDEDMMRVDCVILATMYVEEHSHEHVKADESQRREGESGKR